MTDHNGPHGGWLVPIRTDLDGTTLLLCYIDSQIGTRSDGLALYCPACAATVTGVVPGTAGLSDLDGQPDELADSLLRAEGRLSQQHAAAMTSQPERMTPGAARR